MRTTRPLLVGAALALASVALAPSAALAAPAPPADPNASEHSAAIGENTLRALAEAAGIEIGVAVNTDLLASDVKYRNIVNTQYSSVTAENVMKWEALNPQPGVYDWEAAEALIANAEANGQVVRGHTLVWHNQLPAWLTTGDYSAEELRAILEEHVKTVAAHFAGDIQQWDVVNEVIDDNGTFRETIWYQAYEELGLPGEQYVADVFRWAKEADPEAVLFYNDYNLEFTGPKSNLAYTFVQDLLADGVPIEGVGFQGHLDTQYGYPDLRNNLERFAALGLEVAMTEVDVRTFVTQKPNGTYTNTPADPAEEAQQIDWWAQTLEDCLAVEACNSYTVWGVSDANSWIPGWFTGQGAGLLYDMHDNPKAQYEALREVLRDAS
ncbi:1,4-beta-xylanase [Microbacterium sp. MEC084]|uniref:endo-1,4-beta-xylanase n=1 Tax=unclassified Microbacterium TaxID=2609290 RepID=UPI0006FA36E1|nr:MULTISPECIES: endo-1,4-beta-xylanase [unclassified Microbacterium]KQY99163.1 1,4-beta-xylanase [Microbacterium sp. Root53]MCD1269201.1 1,4-beta-xylanase [Microbacterium sp. MEC084]